MAKSLKSLSKIQKYNIDEQRKILNGYLNEEVTIMRKLKELNENFEREKAYCEKTAELSSFGVYLKSYIDTRKHYEAELAAVKEKIEEIKDIITALYKEQKTYDIVDENREKKELKEEEIKEQQTLDEIGTNAYIRKRKN